mgnify:CR=1 FL=1
MEQFAQSAANTMFGLYDMFSGKNLSQMTIFALGVMPYISSSIIFQLLTVVIPRLTELQQEGEAGYAKINQYTRYLTVVLAALLPAVAQGAIGIECREKDDAMRERIAAITDQPTLSAVTAERALLATLDTPLAPLWVWIAFALLYGICETLFGNWGTVYLHQQRALPDATANLARPIRERAACGKRVPHPPEVPEEVDVVARPRARQPPDDSPSTTMARWLMPE